MYLFTKVNFDKGNVLSLILALFPLSFIAGNMLININIILIIILSLIFFNKELFRTKIIFLDKIFFLYFSLIILTSFINDYYFFTEKMTWKGYFSTVVKSILFLKYLLFYFVVRFLIEKKIVNLKLFFVISFLATLFVTLDIFFQFYNGYDIFGFASVGRKLGGPFGDELIAGGFIQRFSLFAFFLIPIFFNKTILNRFSRYIIPILFIIFFFGLILSGNRMPAIIFILTICLIIILQKETRKFLIPFLVIFFLFLSIIFKTNPTVKANFLNFYGQILKINEFIVNKEIFNEDAPQYLKEFSSFYETWLINKYIGGGIKNFRYYCHTRENIPKDGGFICNMHPHNYYLEILTETGVIGLILVVIIFFNVLYLTFIKKYFQISSLNKNIMIIPFIFLFIAEVFPIKSTGSFFTTGNSTYLFLIIGIMIGLIRRDNLIENKI